MYKGAASNGEHQGASEGMTIRIFHQRTEKQNFRKTIFGERESECLIVSIQIK